jgi:hypothetical protein
MKNFVNGLWVFFGVGGFIGFFSAPITFYVGEEAMTFSLLMGVSSVGVLALLTLSSLWLNGAKARPGILSSAFLGIGIAGVIAFFLQAPDVAMLAVAVAAAGLLITGIMVEASKPKAVIHH